MPFSRLKHIATLLLLFVLLVVLFFIGRTKFAASIYNHGCDLYDRGRYDEALDAFKKSARVNPSVPLIYSMQARAYERKQMPDAALLSYYQAIDFGSGDLEDFKALIAIYFSKGMYEDVAAVLRKAEGAVSLDRQGVLDMARAVSWEAVADCVDRGTELFLSGDTNQAYRLVEKAYILAPDNSFAKYTIAFFDYARRKDADAEQELFEILRKDPGFLPARKLLGDMYLRAGRKNEAIRQYQEGLALESKDVVLNNELGIALNTAERYEEATRHLAKACIFDPANLDLRYNLASAYKDNKDFEAAISEYERILRTNPEYPYVYNDLGDIYQALGRRQEAKQAYQKEIALARSRALSHPDDVVILNDLAYALNGAGEHKEAQKIIEDALRLAANYGQAYWTAAQIYEKTENDKEALSALKKAESFFGDAAFIRDATRRIKERKRGQATF